MAVRRKTYVLQPDALDLIAETDPAFKRLDGKPNHAAIEAAAGIAASTLSHIVERRIGLSAKVMAALVGLYMDTAKVGRKAAETRLIDLVDAEPVAGSRHLATAGAAA